MKVQELIKTLQNYEEKYGNKEVMISECSEKDNNANNWMNDIQFVTFEDCNNIETIRIFYNSDD